ncbi:MAG: hypothetical protein ACI976_000863 [Aureispira sp.]|jgi:hypothetical protein
MKKYTTSFILGLFVLLFTVSCSDETTTAQVDVDTETTRAGKAETMQVNFQGKMVTLEAGDMISMTQATNDEGEDAQALSNMNTAFLSAEKEDQVLDVNFTMSDEPVDNGMFIFGIETKDAKNLTLEMYDEEGYAMVANNKFDITEGNNYKALNVESLSAGSYNFRLKDDSGKEMDKVVTIAEKK